ncbi:hypothetical protein RN607_10240 [Demequina capsici]|uniref:WD40-like Beta Propeller Repeat n=1 Tax=Demequina capsici TaxID=3075620 RepID=A0AA96F5W7_9MICO|nr:MULTISPECIES: hypothetical protein [unclassified Demequina]WNM23738.1 hypothetical protein RN606_10240 [Demequina sp. OYTSA14]WNM26577.1 hypothetical protein RN607_10240 [Demequina sp. PMTSA13]
MARWSPTLGEGSLWPSDAPVVALFGLGQRTLLGFQYEGWSLGAKQTGQMALPADFDAGEQIAIVPGGRAILVNRRVAVPAAEVRKGVPWSTTEGVYRVDVSTGEVDRVGFEPRIAAAQASAYFGGSPDGEHVAIIELWTSATEPWPDTSGMPPEEANALESAHHRHVIRSVRTSIWIATFDGQVPREIYTYGHERVLSVTGGRPTFDEATVPVQWSPDGRLLAVEVRGPEGEFDVNGVRVLDVATGHTVASYPGAYLSGTASWGPDSDRLLLGGHTTHPPRPLSWIQGLDGTRHEIEMFPKPNSMGFRRLRPLGLADNDHLLTAQGLGKRATVLRTNIATGEHEALFSVTGSDPINPVIAQMPPETWL